MQSSWKLLSRGWALSAREHKICRVRKQKSQKFSEIQYVLVNLYVQQQYLLAKLLLISSRARPTGTQISWGQMTFYNSAISNRLMEWRTRTPEVQNTLNIGQFWFGIICWSNLYIVTFEKTGSPLTIMLSSHIFSPNPRNNPPWECSRRADFCAQTQIRDDFESAPSPSGSLRLHDEQNRTRGKTAMMMMLQWVFRQKKK